QNNAADGRQADGEFVENDDLVIADLYRVVELIDYVNAADGLSGIECEVFLILIDIALQHAVDAKLCGDVFLPERIRLIADLVEKSRVYHAIGNANMIGGRHIAFPQ